MFTAPHVILGLKLAVGLVTILFVASIIAIAGGRRKLHGRINFVFFCLTMTAVLAFEVIIRFINTDLTAPFTPEEKSALRIHLCFSIPSAIVLPFMLFTGPYYPRIHKPLAVLFTLLWAGTFYTGIFTLPIGSAG